MVRGVLALAGISAASAAFQFDGLKFDGLDGLKAFDTKNLLKVSDNFGVGNKGYKDPDQVFVELASLPVDINGNGVLLDIDVDGVKSIATVKNTNLLADITVFLTTNGEEQEVDCDSSLIDVPPLTTMTCEALTIWESEDDLTFVFTATAVPSKERTSKYTSDEKMTEVTGTASVVVPFPNGFACPTLTSADPNLMINQPETAFLLDVATFSCEGVTELDGATELVCLPDGVWSNPVPTCTLEQSIIYDGGLNLDIEPQSVLDGWTAECFGDSAWNVNPTRQDLEPVVCADVGDTGVHLGGDETNTPDVARDCFRGVVNGVLLPADDLNCWGIVAGSAGGTFTSDNEGGFIYECPGNNARITGVIGQASLPGNPAVNPVRAYVLRDGAPNATLLYESDQENPKFGFSDTCNLGDKYIVVEQQNVVAIRYWSARVVGGAPI